MVAEYKAERRSCKHPKLRSRAAHAKGVLRSLQYRLAPSCAYAHKILLGLFVIYSAETNMSLLI
ncbi:hypothetical protein SY86_05140 [Erwinia tracheiphila]|uniref:Uncharacterized protein n=1 Tax=Erwinia tracheiphila TaxID=65700 RepID=A0A0M2KDA3_9GAMM|nr:hypothetical protein SY86_05140 [Erwinia tracheiphila]